MRALIVLSVGLVVASCGGEVSSTKRVRQASIYGLDERTEVLEADEPWRDIGSRGVMALLFPRALVSKRIDFCDGDTAQFRGPTVGEDNGLCSSVRFQEQPFAAGCSATLVAPALLMTAKHCVVPADGVMAFRGFFMQGDGGLPVLSPGDVSSVRRVMVSDTQDLALVELTAPVENGRVVPLVGDAVDVGAPVTVIGYPNGGPAKVASNCHVLQRGALRFASNCEVFPGNSGSGLFDENGALAGVVVSTASGVFRMTDAGCRIDFVYTDGGLLPGGIGAPQLTNAIDPRGFVNQVCDGGYASSLCGRGAFCGDGQCTDEETSTTCSEDCAVAKCGDGLCGGSELLDCVADCGEAACSFVADAGVTEPPPVEPRGCSSTGVLSTWLALVFIRLKVRAFGAESARRDAMCRATRSI